MTTNASVVAAKNACACSGKAHYIPESSEPSLFTTVKGEVNPEWVNWFATRYKLSKKTANNIGVALHDYLEAGEGYELTEYTPSSPYVKDTQTISMMFVLDCSRRYDMALTEACRIAESLKKIDTHPSGMSYAINALEPEIFARPKGMRPYS